MRCKVEFLPKARAMLLLASWLVASTGTAADELRYASFVDSLKLNPEAEPTLLAEVEVFHALKEEMRWQAACEIYGQYFKKRQNGVPPFPPVSDWIDAEVAYGEQALKGDFHFMGRWYRIGPEIDWHTRQHGLEWLAALHRHYHVAKTSSAFEKTGDERYAAEAIRFLTSWLFAAEGFVPQPGQYDPFWNILNVSERINLGWNGTLKWLWSSQSFTNAFACELGRSMAEHGRILAATTPRAGNIGMLHNKALMIVGIMLREHTHAAEWRRLALERMIYRAERDMYPDGSGVELAFGYGNSVVGSILEIKRVVDPNPHLAVFPQDAVGKLEEYYNYAMSVTKPSGFAPNLGDTNNAIFIPSILKTGAELFPHREDFQWFASGEGQPPAFKSIANTYSGHYVMRSDWGRDARYLHFDGGPFGDGFHGHEDKLSFIASAYGKEILVEAGGWFPYGNFPEFRYARSGFAHNTLAVDGYSQSSRQLGESGGQWFHQYPYAKPLDNPWFSAEKRQFVSAEYSLGFGPELTKVRHRRSIFFLMDRYWLVFDSIEPQDGREHEFELYFHLAALDAEVESDTIRASYGDGVQLLGRLWSSSDLSHRIIAGKGEAQGVPVWNAETMTSANLMQGWAGILGDWKPVPTLVSSAKSKKAMVFVSIWHPYRESDGLRLSKAAMTTTGVGSSEMSVQWSDGSSEFVRYTHRDSELIFEIGHEGQAPWFERQKFVISRSD